MGIRMATTADTAELLAIYSQYIDTSITFEYTLPSRAEFSDRIAGILAEYPYLVWQEDGRILGYAYASAPFERAAYAWCAEPSIYLRQDARGRGIGKRLYAALEALLSQMGYQVSFAIITGENRTSLAFHRALGYEKCAEMVKCGLKFGRWLDVEWLEKRLNPVEIPSNFPIAWNEFSKDAQKVQNILGKLSLSESGKV